MKYTLKLVIYNNYYYSSYINAEHISNHWRHLENIATPTSHSPFLHLIGGCPRQEHAADT